MNPARHFADADHEWMQHALLLARRAGDEGEVPVGAVVVQDDELIGEGWNRSIALSDPSAHAEIVALRNAGARIQNYRMPGCTLYVTLEPCAMCVAAVIHARLERMIFAAADPKTGALGGAYSLPAAHSHNHEVEIHGGLLGDEASAILRGFFQQKRIKRDS